MKIGTIVLKFVAGLMAALVLFAILFPVFARAKSYSGPVMSPSQLRYVVEQYRAKTGKWPETAFEIEPYLSKKLKARPAQYAIEKEKVSQDGKEADYRLWVKRGSWERTVQVHLRASS